MLSASFGFAQIGIGTTTPTPGYALDVAGSVLIQDELKLKALPDEITQNAEFKFLMRVLNSEPAGEVGRLDVEQVSVAPINIVNYTFHNLQKDNVSAVNLQFPASKYVVGIANFRYEGQVIKKGGSKADNIGNFVTRTYVDGPSGGTWHLEIQNRSLDAASDNAITYHVTLIVYDKKYFKQLPSIPANLNGQSVGAAATAPAGL